jgi:hypothetical protein
MANNRDEYQDIDDTLPKTSGSIYSNPIFDGHDEVKQNLK